MANEMRDRLVEIFKKIEYTPFPNMTMKSNLAMQFTDYALYSIIDDLITNDVVPVVRCKDCEYYSEPNDEFNYHHCDHYQWDDSEGWAREIKENNYCSYGERKYKNDK